MKPNGRETTGAVSLAARLRTASAAASGSSSSGGAPARSAATLAGRRPWSVLAFQIWSSSDSKFRKFDFKFPNVQVLSDVQISRPKKSCVKPFWKICEIPTRFSSFVHESEFCDTWWAWSVPVFLPRLGCFQPRACGRGSFPRELR